jgi:hypothetical protein
LVTSDLYPRSDSLRTVTFLPPVVGRGP